MLKFKSKLNFNKISGCPKSKQKDQVTHAIYPSLIELKQKILGFILYIFKKERIYI